MKKISIARDFSDTPGFRYPEEGPNSGAEFRERHLVPLFANPDDKSEIEINLDGVAGYATSFLEEAFGGLARLYGVDRCIQRLHFISEEEPLLPQEIKSYMNRAVPK